MQKLLSVSASSGGLSCIPFSAGHCKSVPMFFLPSLPWLCSMIFMLLSWSFSSFFSVLYAFRDALFSLCHIFLALSKKGPILSACWILQAFSSCLDACIATCWLLKVILFIVYFLLLFIFLNVIFLLEFSSLYFSLLAWVFLFFWTLIMPAAHVWLAQRDASERVAKTELNRFIAHSLTTHCLAFIVPPIVADYAAAQQWGRLEFPFYYFFSQIDYKSAIKEVKYKI